PPERRDEIRSVFGLGEDIGVIGLVAGGPGERAGLRADDRIVAIDGSKLDGLLPPVKGTAGFDRMQAFLDRLESVGAAGQIRLIVERQGQALEILLTPTAGCPAEIVLLPSARRNAYADGRYLVVTSAMVEFVADDAELSFVLAHELAHNILQHR